MTIRNVIVTGATGRQGRGFIHALLNPSNTNGPTAPTYRIWAITRDAASPAATRLLEIEKSHGNDIRIVQGDLSNADRLKQIFTEVAAEGGIFGVFIVLPYPGLGNNGGDEERQGKALVDLAIEFKVEALVYSSTIPPGPDLANGIDASRLAKREIELYCKGMGEKGLNWSIVQPGIFMENFDGLMGALAVSVFSQGLQKETEMLLIASEDIGKVAAGVIQNHERYTHKTVTVAGGSYTMDEVKKSYKEVMGKNMPAFPAILAWLALKLSVGVQHVVQDTERIYQARVSGRYPTLEEEIEAAKAVCEMQDFRTWLLRRKEKQS
ncbi:NAD(P)-binding protein [Trichoderma asperelloides]|nr:NAD(P)-binding protein [Trichoderma asperelloides]